MKSSLVVAFIAISLVFIVIPGPSVVFAVGRAIAGGPAVGVVTVAGNAIGVFVQGLLVAIGLGAVISHLGPFATYLRIAGALYLSYLGIKTFRGRREELHISDGQERGSLPSIFRTGVLVGLSNPKTAIFMAAILPQFVGKTSMSPILQMVLLNVIFLLMGFTSDSMWALAAGTLRRWLSSSRKRLEAVTGTGGALIFGLGLYLALFGK
ncbi:MAG: LysE family translocator [Actinomycetota bacterium]|nr:LysE family translocator [Actinomycetota bacterium]